MDGCLVTDGEQMVKLVCCVKLCNTIVQRLVPGTGDEATLANFTPAVGDIQSKMVSQVETCIDSCFALAGIMLNVR